MSAPRADAPTLGVLATGGIGVLVVLAFVGAVVFGRNTEVKPGDRIAVVRSESPAGFSILAGRCTDERVNAVEVRAPVGPTLWRIESKKGVINRAFSVGGEPPFGAATVTPLQPLPTGTLVAAIRVGDTEDVEQFDPAHLETADAPEAPCGGADLGLVPLLFVAGAAGVVVAYGGLVRRYLQAR
ncbi:MAG TPA: hypothetical protein VFU93_00160 [Acidimicrobiales bacterium]|nr:hypothetical protein [Acidimicrobiales bacterium]